MRGYLQQIIATAAGLERTVHPVIGSIFQGTGLEETLETSAPIKQTNAVDSEQRSATTLVASEAQPMAPGAEPVQPKPPMKADQVAVSERAATLVPREAAALRRPMSREQESQVSRPEEHLRSSDTRQLATFSREQHQHESTKGEALPEAGSLMLRPLLVQDRPKEEPIGEELPDRQPMRKADAPAAYPERNHFRQRPALKRDESKQSEDIQIHIGRIEVMAVPPAPAPRPAKPARKSLNLQEYLRQHGGNAR